MSTYLIGDIHGCYSELITLLQKTNFSPFQDTIWLTGDLVSRGPCSLEVLRYIKSLGNRVRLVLGNHDLHLLAVYSGISRNKPKDHFKLLLEAPDVDELLNWLRIQPLIQIDEEKKLVMTHAGIAPQWDLKTAKKYAKNVEKILASDCYFLFLDAIFNDSRNEKFTKRKKISKLCFIVNVFTRMRYCSQNGELDMRYKNTPDSAPNSIKPWFNIPSTIATEYSIVFGHWASLEGKGTPKGIYALDTGCCWGGMLTCLRWEDKMYFVQPSCKRIDSSRK